MPVLSVVIPVHNEGETVRSLSDETRAALGTGDDYEIVFVDDGSTDETARELEAIRRSDARVRILHHRQRCGQSTALRSGIRAARAQWIVTLDGDGQNDPADISRLLAARDAANAPSNIGLVNGHRRVRRDTWVKRASSRVANQVRASLLHDATPDSGCGIRLFRRSLFLELPFFDHMHRFIPALILRHGGAVLSVEVNHRPRQAGASHYGLLDRAWAGLIDLLGVLWLQRRMQRPDVVEKD